MECCAGFDNGVFGVGAVRREHVVKAGDAIAWLEFEYL